MAQRISRNFEKIMHNEDDAREFLIKSDQRISEMLNRASRMRLTTFFENDAKQLESLFEGSKIHFYGTRVMQLGHEKSHLNMYLETENSYKSTLSPEKIEKIIQQLEIYFKTVVFVTDPMIPPASKPIKSWHKPMSRLKTPTMTLRVQLRKLQCDITFDSGLGVENTKLIHHLFSMQPEAFKLYHFARIWIHIDEFAFKRYMVALLVIFYLQQKNLLPSVVQLQKDADETWIAGWNVGFDRKKTLKSLGLDVLKKYHEHLIGFFHFYQNFDFKNNVICPYLGREVPVSEFSNSNENFQKFTGNLKGFNFQAVNVADMFNLNFNVAFGVGKKRISKFVPFCGNAVEILRDHFDGKYDIREE